MRKDIYHCFNWKQTSKESYRLIMTIPWVLASCILHIYKCVCVYIFILSTTYVYKLMVLSIWLQISLDQLQLVSMYYHTSRIQKKERRRLRFMCTANKRTKQGTSVWRDYGWLTHGCEDGLDMYGWVCLTVGCQDWPYRGSLSACLSAYLPVCCQSSTQLVQAGRQGKASPG